MAEVHPAGLSMWVPCLVFAHLFSAYWLAKALARLAPELWSKLLGALFFWRGAVAGGAALTRRVAEAQPLSR
jgi:hypothetical protein